MWSMDKVSSCPQFDLEFPEMCDVGMWVCSFWKLMQEKKVNQFNGVQHLGGGSHCEWHGEYDWWDTFIAKVFS